MIVLINNVLILGNRLWVVDIYRHIQLYRGIILVSVTGIEDVNRPKVYPNQGSQTRIMTFHKHT
jgi:hypothetical protein